ncbi:hypothetical protein BvRS1_43360 [Burkholderia vietnamiensis]|nr:hypothetical protein BvRS1_43360 [Burkholderia vietnamiensis]
MGQNINLTGVALSVATVFGVLASGSAMAAALDALPIPQVIVNPPTNNVSVGLAATGTSPLGSVTVTTGGAGALQTSLGNPAQALAGVVNGLPGALGGSGGTVTPLAPVQGGVNQVTGALGSVGGGGNPAGGGAGRGRSSDGCIG